MYIEVILKNGERYKYMNVIRESIRNKEGFMRFIHSDNKRVYISVDSIMLMEEELEFGV